MSSEDNKRERRGWIIASAFAFEVVGLVVGGVWLGSWLDRQWHMSPTFMMVGMLLAFLVAGMQLGRVIKAQQEEEENQE